MEWKLIPGFSEYAASSNGEIRRILPPANHQDCKVLKQRIGKCGRRTVTPKRDKDSKFHPVFVHRLVALAWIGPQPTPKHQIDHIDRDQSNNRWTNLRWVTSKENHANADHRGERSANARLTWTKVAKIRSMYPKKNQREIGKLFGVTQANVSEILSFKTWRV